jgi:Ca-activated chloride channel family protein
MSFASPGMLVGLVVLPLLVAWYLGEQRRRQAARAAFASPALEASVAPHRPHWRRHVPMAALGIAAAALIVAAAKPQRTVAVPIERASIVLVTDVSGSMLAKDVSPNRLTAAKAAARRFLAEVPARVNVGVIAFNQVPRVLQSPTSDRQAVLDAIARMKSSGGTATGDALASATSVLRTVQGEAGRRPPAAIVLLTDGASTSGRDPLAAAATAKDLRIPIYTVALGTTHGTITVPKRGGGTETKPVPPDPESLAAIAKAAGGKSYTAETASGLTDVYRRLGSQLGHKREKREVTTAFAGGGLALLLTGIASSLAWFGRVI